MTLQVEEATLPSSKSDEKSLKQSTRTRSSRSKVTVKDEELTGEEPQANGDVTEDQLQVSNFMYTCTCRWQNRFVFSSAPSPYVLSFCVSH